MHANLRAQQCKSGRIRKGGPPFLAQAPEALFPVLPQSRRSTAASMGQPEIRDFDSEEPADEWKTFQRVISSGITSNSSCGFVCRAPLRENEIDARQKGVEMNEKIIPRASSATSCPEGKAKYVLEDVFWVPVSNCRARHFTVPGQLELHSPKTEIDGMPGLDESERRAASTVASLVQRSAIPSGVGTRFAQTRGRRRQAVRSGGKH
jgi:hypothetical protein